MMAFQWTVKNGEYLSLQHVLKVALSAQEARDLSKCYFVCDRVLFRKKMK